MLKWIDGEGENREGQLPEYSAILPDELFHMFYGRTWYEDDQIDALATLNMCRDRHILITGNVPNFWDLDSGFRSRVRFYVYIPYRGTAWVFEQENSPFAKDSWNAQENRTKFRVKKKPYAISNFICEIRFPDWSSSEKAQYYKIRNVKRVVAIQEGREKRERYKVIKVQRDNIMRTFYLDRTALAKIIKKLPIDYAKLLKHWKKPVSCETISQITELSNETVRLIVS